MSRPITILIAVLLIASAAVAGGGPRQNGLRPEGDAAAAMARAQSLYRDGQLEKALRCLERAQKLLALEVARKDEPRRQPPSNARQLLKYLGIYADFAYGQDPQLDEAHDFLVDKLRIIAAIEAGGGEAAARAGWKYSAWMSGQVHRLGEFSVRHWASGQIFRLGPYSVRYWADGRPFHIGGIDYRYGIDGTWPRRVARVDLD